MVLRNLSNQWPLQVILEKRASENGSDCDWCACLRSAQEAPIDEKKGHGMENTGCSVSYLKRRSALIPSHSIVSATIERRNRFSEQCQCYAFYLAYRAFNYKHELLSYRF